MPITETQKSVPWLAHVPGRDITTTDGRQLTLLNPASMLRQMMDRHAEYFGIRGRIIGLKYLNPGNAPDTWETEQLRVFERGEKKEIWGETEINGQPYLRYLRAMYMEPGCEKCHAILGYKLGDLRGATGLNLPLKPYLARLQAATFSHVANHGGIWLFGLMGIFWIGRKTRLQDEQRKENESRIARAELWYRSLFEQSHDGILVFDPETQVFIEFNKIAHESLSYTAEEFANIRIADFDVEETEQDTTTRISRINEFGWDRFETRHKKKDGQLIDVQVVVQRLSANGKTLFLYSFRDITERKLLDAELEKHRHHLEEEVSARTLELAEKNTALENAFDQLKATQRHLIQSEKLSSLGALVAGIAHELNTPIGNARTIATSLSERTQDFNEQLLGPAGGLKRSELIDYLGYMQEGTTLLDHSMLRAADLVHSFKQVAVDRTSSLRRIFDLRKVLTDVLSTMHPTLKKTPYVVDLAIPSDITLDSYPGPLGQVLVNLVDNAILHGLDEAPQGNVHISACICNESASPEVHIQVEDNGRGIPAENMNRIFDPFFTTRLGKGGSGLGLNIVHNLVTGVLGGSISVESEIGKGTCFTVVIPTVANAPHPNDPPPPLPPTTVL